MTTARGRSLHMLASVAFVVLLVMFARRVDWRAAAAAARNANTGLLVLALCFNQLSLVLKGTRWWVFLRAVGVRSFRLVLRATYAGASLNNLVVAQGGEAARVVIVSRASGVAGTRVASALALERVLDGVSYLMLLVSAAFILDLPETLTRWRAEAVVALACATVALLLLGATSRSRSVSMARANTVLGRMASTVRRFASSVSETATLPRLATGMALSVCAWALQVATYHTVALAAHLPISLAGSTTAMLVIGVSFLIRATPGNVGVFQVLYVLTMNEFQVGASAALAAALLIQLVQVVPTVVLGTVAGYGLAGEAERRKKTRRARVE
jgi:uncharacterized protein (TIRG00374 family)